MKKLNDTILVVDDEDDIRELLADVLRKEGYEVLEADNGKDGLALALEKKPDLILLDVIMPGETGHEVLKKLRRDDWGKNVKVLILTALDDVDNISKGIEAGSDDYLMKSAWTIKDITKKVKQKLAGYG